VTPPNNEVLRAIVRLNNDPDFKTFLQWLEDEEALVNADLKRSTQTVLVHQLQGSSLVLEDIRLTVMSAPVALAGQAKRQ
jgi:hypothetical protein